MVSSSARTALRLLMLTRCRRNEILTLRWEDVDLEHDELRLRDAKSGPRAVSLSPTARGIQVDLPRTPDNPWVIPGSLSGRHLANLNAAWQVAPESAELEHVRMHDLRHSHAAVAVETGEGLRIVAGLLGHADIETTFGYAHLAEDGVLEAANRVSRTLADALDREDTTNG